jgi:HAD superfamily hydrolase (TIGR01509 family)
MISAVIFDMDGVMVNSEEFWFHAEKAFYEGLIPGISWDKMASKFAGMNIHNTFEYLKTNHGLKLGNKKFFEAFTKMAYKIYSEQVSLPQNLIELLDKLKATGFKLAIASNSPLPWINKVIERFELSKYFERVISADHVGNVGKPAPDIYLHTALLLDKDPGECLVIEDTRTGILAAKNASMKCVAIRGEGNDQDLALADLEIKDFKELTPEKIRNL